MQELIEMVDSVLNSSERLVDYLEQSKGDVRVFSFDCMVGVGLRYETLRFTYPRYVGFDRRGDYFTFHLDLNKKLSYHFHYTELFNQNWERVAQSPDKALEYLASLYGNSPLQKRVGRLSKAIVNSGLSAKELGSALNWLI